mmetsp:Transcript_13049/g.31704  ORF Transcript_13049/g.31704 Transcript_13049/m.31704 type:complete len:285 (-) Transcript_13049:252-1106(-)
MHVLEHPEGVQQPRRPGRLDEALLEETARGREVPEVLLHRAPRVVERGEPRVRLQALFVELAGDPRAVERVLEVRPRLPEDSVPRGLLERRAQHVPPLRHVLRLAGDFEARHPDLTGLGVVIAHGVQQRGRARHVPALLQCFRFLVPEHEDRVFGDHIRRRDRWNDGDGQPARPRPASPPRRLELLCHQRTLRPKHPAKENGVAFAEHQVRRVRAEEPPSSRSIPLQHAGPPSSCCERSSPRFRPGRPLGRAQVHPAHCRESGVRRGEERAETPMHAERGNYYR